MVCTSVRKFGLALMGLFDLFKHIYLILPILLEINMALVILQCTHTC